MPSDRIEREILIEAPVDVVWGVVTEPEQIKRWFTDAADLDVRPGGNGTLRWDAKATNDPATAHLRVEAVEPPHRFAFRWDFPEDAEPGPDNSLLVEFTLVAEGDSTRLRLVESGFDAARSPGRRQGAVHRRPQPRLGRPHGQPARVRGRAARASAAR